MSSASEVPAGSRVAIVGSGVSGLVAAHLLKDRHDLAVFEADDRIGGHVHTVDVDDAAGATHAVDTGFIVFNAHNYPRFCALLDELGVHSQASTMSFSVASETGWEYSGAGVAGLFAQKRNAASPAHWSMIRGILRFFREAPRLLEDGAAMDGSSAAGSPGQTLGDYLTAGRYSRPFVERFILPMGAAIWSATDEQILRFPASHFVRFFHHHRMLQLRDRPQWRVVKGGSRTYVEALVRPLRERIRTSTPVRAVRRLEAREGSSPAVEIDTDRGTEVFAAVVLAVHSDQALKMLGADASAAEREILGAVGYQGNDVVLHRDARVLPRTRKAWSAWNVHLPGRARSTRRRGQDGSAPVQVSYHMNALQGLDAQSEFVVTLNKDVDRDRGLDPEHVLRRLHYAHPVLDGAAVRAQGRHGEISGWRRTYYCGAWWGFGFHEDGVHSGERVALQLGGRNFAGVRS